MATFEKKCALCTHVFSGNTLLCPKCGSGVFETQKTQPRFQLHRPEPLSIFKIAYRIVMVCVLTMPVLAVLTL